MVVGVSLIAAGCGGSSDSTSTDASPTSEWADGLCSAINTWTASISSIGDTIKSGDISKDSLTSAVDDAKSATETLTSDLEGLGKPDTEAGQEAKDSIDKLSTDLQAEVKTIQDGSTAPPGSPGSWPRPPRSQRARDDGHRRDVDCHDPPGPRREGRARERVQGYAKLQRPDGQQVGRGAMKDDSTRAELMAIPIVAVLFGIGLVLFIAAVKGLWAWLFVGARRVVLAAVL